MTKATRTIHHRRWQNVVDTAAGWCESNILPCVAIVTGTAETISGRIHSGRQSADKPEPLREDAIFLIASITKPVVAMAALKLIENGHLTLADRVVDFIPGVGREGKYGIEIRHLLTQNLRPVSARRILSTARYERHILGSNGRLVRRHISSRVPDSQCHRPGGSYQWH